MRIEEAEFKVPMVLNAVRERVDEDQVEAFLNFCLERQRAWRVGMDAPFPIVDEIYPDWEAQQGVDQRHS